jgi:hypothetical protein
VLAGGAEGSLVAGACAHAPKLPSKMEHTVRPVESFDAKLEAAERIENFLRTPLLDAISGFSDQISFGNLQQTPESHYAIAKTTPFPMTGCNRDGAERNYSHTKSFF